ncbi:MAG: sigma 54-interacting transcriptional regulator [Myxococcales bacterium]|nr:sigma 54-interacting transcriptional regulator [Myxococcales bacterium]
MSRERSRAARGLPVPGATCEDLLVAAQAALDRADFRGARALAERAVARADRDPRDGARAASRRLLATALLLDDDATEAERVAAEAVRVARTARSYRDEALGELVLADVRRAAGEYIAGLKHAARARTLAARAKDPATERVVLADYALLLGRLGDHERAREAFELLLATPLDDLPPSRAFRVLYNLAGVHRAAGRFSEAFVVLGQAADLADGGAGGHADWALRHARVQTLLDVGAFSAADAILGEAAFDDDAPSWQRAQHLALEATLALEGTGDPRRAVALAEQGLALPALLRPVRFALEKVRADAHLALGGRAEAERVGIALMGPQANAGIRLHAAEALALAARAGPPGAWLLRWLGALAIAGSGAAGRVEHEACAALVSEPDPIGSLARATLPVLRARLVDRTPTEHRAPFRRLLRRIERRLAEQRAHGASTAADARVSEPVRRAMTSVGLVGESPALLGSVATLARAARSATSVLLLGETGAGKELFARLVHQISERARGPFVAINCGAVPEPLLEAELFGHERGAFTGAERARRGLFEEAEGGTLFLDEVAEMTPQMQVKLLRVLEDREVRALGGGRARKVDLRVVAATHRALPELVERGAFRQDLYYRLAALTVPVPSLRERMEDIPLVARALLAREPGTRAHTLDVPALTSLTEHAWPGNVRELGNVLRAAAALADGLVIGRPDITAAMARAPAGGPRAERELRETTLSALRARHQAELRELVGRAIAAADGNKREAARALGLSRQGLYRVLERGE